MFLDFLRKSFRALDMKMQWDLRRYIRQIQLMFSHGEWKKLLDPRTYWNLRQMWRLAEQHEWKKLEEKIKDRKDIVVLPLRTVRDWASIVGLPLLEVGEEEKIPFKFPHVFGSPANSEIIIALSNKPYVAEIPNARVFSHSSIILTSDGTALSDSGAHPRFGRDVSFMYETIVFRREVDTLLVHFCEFKTREIEEGILLSGLFSNYYGHWLPEFLPKLQFLQQHPDFANLPLIVDSGMPQSHFDHLRRLCHNPLILLQPNESLRCRRLLVAPSPTFFPAELLPNNIPVQEMPGLSPQAMRFLRGEITHHTKYCKKRLFLARKNMKWRRLLNEDEITVDLNALGFETVFMEEMTINNQIDLFQQAEWIVAPNGSALLNLIFADPQNVKLLVLTQPNLFNWGTFQGPMDELGYQSMCVTGDYAEAEDQKHSDYRVPVKKIREALFSWGMSEALNE